jgi:hypothetical protein
MNALQRNAMPAAAFLANETLKAMGFAANGEQLGMVRLHPP